MKYAVVKICSCLIFLILFADHGIKAQEVEKLRIDPSQAFGGRVSDYFEQVNYIPLETTKQSLFGDISQLIITDSSFVIFDWDTRSALFFTRDGRYITKTKFKEDTYPSLSHEKANHRIAVSVWDPAQKKATLTYYSLTGKELEEKQSVKSKTQTNLISLGDGFAVGIGNCYFSPGMIPKDSINYLLKVYKGDSVYKSFFPYNQTVNAGACVFGNMTITPSSQEGAVYVSPPLDGGIYRVTKDTVVKLYQVVFPMSRSVPKMIAESKDAKLIDSLRNANWPGENIITGISNIFLHKNLLFFKTDAKRYSWSQGSETTKQYNFIYDTKTARLVSIERMSPDEQNGFLPLSNYRIYVWGLKYEDGYFYSNVSSLQLFTAKEATADRKPKYSPAMEKYFATESRKSNPVIVQLKLKE